jgi:hypothetical protein
MADGCACAVGYNELDFLKKIQYTDPLMGAKLKSKTHLLNRFFDFWRRFWRVFATVFKTSSTNLKSA